MAAFGGIGDLIGIKAGSATPILQGFYTIIPIIFWAVLIIGSIFFLFWLRKFRYIVYVHSQRADGEIIIIKTRGGFFTNFRTKVERLRLLNDLKAFIPPPPNRFIKMEGRKDIIHLIKTTGKEYVPMMIIKEDKYVESNKAFFCAKCKKNYLNEEGAKDLEKCSECKEKVKKVNILIEKRDFQVHSELAKDWFEIATNEDERKYAIGNWLLQNQTLVIVLTWGAVFLMSVMFIMGQVENAINMGGSVIANCKQPVATLAFLIPASIFRRFKKWK